MTTPPHCPLLCPQQRKPADSIVSTVAIAPRRISHSNGGIPEILPHSLLPDKQCAVEWFYGTNTVAYARLHILVNRLSTPLSVDFSLSVAAPSAIPNTEVWV